MNKRTIAARLAVVAATAPLAVGLAAGTASAETITLFEGCYGASSVIVCDGELSYTLPYDVESYQTTVPVCAGTCTNVPVTLFRTVSTGQPLALCFSRTSHAGVTTTTCTADVVGTVGALAEQVVDIIDNIDVEDLVRFEDCWGGTGWEIWIGNRRVDACLET